MPFLLLGRRHNELQELNVLLNMALDELGHERDEVGREGLQHRVLEQSGVAEDMLDGVIEDGRFHGGELPLDDELVLIFRPVGLLDIGGDAEILFGVFTVGLENIGGNLVEFRRVGGDDEVLDKELINHLRQLALSFLAAQGLIGEQVGVELPRNACLG